jgi:hypothetical protein
MKDVQAQDILIPRLSPRTALWEGEAAALALEFSCFSGAAVNGGSVEWEIEGHTELRGSEPVQIVNEPSFGSYALGAIAVEAPHAAAPSKQIVSLTLRDRAGRVLARGSQNIVFVPAARRAYGGSTALWIYDPSGRADGVEAWLAAAGARVVESPESGGLALVTRWDESVARFARDGGRVVLVASHADSLPRSSGLGIGLADRSTNGWWGDWCTTKTWFVPELFPSLPDTTRFDFEYHAVMPQRVLTGVPTESTVAGLFAGWLHNPAALVARLQIGRGTLVATTFDVLPHIGDDPIATLLLADLMAMATAG